MYDLTFAGPESTLVHMTIHHAAAQAAVEEAETASLLRDKADEHEKNGNHRQEKVYRNAAARADARANVFRDLLR